MGSYSKFYSGHAFKFLPILGRVSLIGVSLARSWLLRFFLACKEPIGTDSRSVHLLMDVACCQKWGGKQRPS